MSSTDRHSPTTADTSRTSLDDGRLVVNLAGTGLWDFAPAPSGEIVASLRGGKLVLLDADGRVLLERVDLGEHGVVISESSGVVSGDETALRRTFVRADGGVLVRADEFVRR